MKKNNFKSGLPGKTLVFNKWANKGYSLFSTIRKEVVISVLAISYFVSVPLTSVASDRDTSEVKMEYEIDEIEVSKKELKLGDNFKELKWVEPNQLDDIEIAPNLEMVLPALRKI
mgnify:CR=1 FL=1